MVAKKTDVTPVTMDTRPSSEERTAVTEKLQQKKDIYRASMDTWTDEDFDAHYSTLDQVYSTSMHQINYLGDFSKDPNFHYHWHTISDDHEDKYMTRYKLGYRTATLEDLKKSGLERRTSDGSLYGETVVKCNVKGGQEAILLKIPKNLYDLNQRMKYKLRDKQNSVDVHGNSITRRIKKEANNVEVVLEDCGEIGIDSI